jgi:hypothetical protein
MLAFIVALNYHSHSNKTVNIYVMEETTQYLLPNYMYIINIAYLNLETYNDFSLSARAATLTFKNTGVDMFSKKTRFNILANSDLNLTAMVQNTNITDRERKQLAVANTGFVVNRCNFKMDNFNVYSEFTSSPNFLWMKAIYIQSRHLQLLNMNLRMNAFLFDTSDPINLQVANFSVEHNNNFRVQKGFFIQSACNYTEASLSTTISFTNITVTDSLNGDAPMSNPFINIAGPSNVTMTGASLSMYSSTASPVAPIIFTSIASCNPSDGLVQTFDIDNSTFSMMQNDEQTRFTQISCLVASNYNRELSITFSSNSFSGLTMNQLPVLEFLGHLKESISIRNLNLTGFSFASSALYFSKVKQLSLTNIDLTNVFKFGMTLVRIIDSTNVDINGMTFKNCTSESMSNLFFVEDTSANGYLNITNFNFISTDVGSMNAIYAPSIPSFSLSNSVFGSSMIDPENSLIELGALSEFKFSNVTMSKITSSEEGDSSNIILDVDSFSVQTGKSLAISGVTITESNVAFFALNRISNSGNMSSTFSISNFSYTNSSFSLSNNLLAFSRMELNTAFIIALSDIMFSDITFSIKGNLMSFSQQLSQDLTITNLQVINTKNARIHTEASNIQNKQLPVRVTITNLTTSNVDSGDHSLVDCHEGSITRITASTIENIYSTSVGSFLIAGYKAVQVFITNSSIQHNSASEGGVFLVENDSVLTIDNCTITNNFAIVGGVLKAQDNGIFVITNSLIYSNYALSISIAQLFDVPSTASISGSEIYSNELVSKSDVLSYIQSSTK